MLADDAVFLSPAAQSWLNLRAAPAHAARRHRDLALRVAGPVQRARPASASA
jgi:putative ABC transport system permease protein